MGVIRVLSEKTINQIAAGEVIESPVSVVKELIENSLDAGAKKIWVEIRGGGFQLIQVADDGCGMSRDDAILCFERHATSKISEIEDLNQLGTMGFRGEALASIAAISKVELLTAQEGKDGVSVQVEGGSVREVKPASRSHGTTLTIRSLFYNVPARKKFQKSSSALTADVHKLLFALALAHPEIGFEFKVSEAVIFSVFPEKDDAFISSLNQRIEFIFGNSFLQTRRPLALLKTWDKKQYSVEGWIGSPVDHRTNRSGQYLFINRRWVVSPSITWAVKTGYGHRIDERRHPIFVLHLTVPSEELDVNVHPQKREVRFENEDILKNFIIEAIQHSFKAPATEEVTLREPLDVSLPEVALRFQEEKTIEPAPWIETPDVVGLLGPYLLLNDLAGGITWVHLQKAEQYLLLQSLQTSSGVHSQGLLIPIPLVLTREQRLMLDEKQTVLHQMGFMIEESGKESYLIQAIPSCLETDDAVEAVRQALEGEDPFGRVAAFAVRGKKRFMLQEALALWKQVKGLARPEFIAHTGVDVIEDFFR